MGLFKDDPDVLFFSMHRHEAGFFPNLTSAVSLGDVVDGAAQTVNVPMTEGFDDSDVCYVMRYVLRPLLERFCPDAIFVSAGFDAVEGDHLGGCKVSPEGFG